jgi:hypothetical protein
MKRKEPESTNADENQEPAAKKQKREQVSKLRYAILTNLAPQSFAQDTLRKFFQNNNIDPLNGRCYLCSRGSFVITLSEQEFQLVEKSPWYIKHIVCDERVSHITNKSGEWSVIDQQDPDFVQDPREFESVFGDSWQDAELIWKTSVKEIDRITTILESSYNIPKDNIEILSQYRPLVIRVKNFASNELTKEILDFCLKNDNFDKNSHISGIVQGNVPLEELRKSKSWSVYHDTLDEKMRDLMRVPKFQSQSVIRYCKGDFVKPHYDVGDRSRNTRRSWTSLIYLNDLPSQAGGKTTFTRIRPKQLHVEPVRGDLIMFLNGFLATTPLTTRRVWDWETRHCGGEVFQDGATKWIYQMFGDTFSVEE